MSRLKSKSDPTSIGSVARIWGQVSEDALARAVQYQDENPDKLLGQAMLEVGVLEPHALDQLVRKQRELRKHMDRQDVARIVDYAAEQTRTTSDRILELAQSITPEDEF